MNSYDVAALGEILIDFTSAGVSSAGQALFERNPGGAPANVAVAIARLGGRSAFIGKTGKDLFGNFLEQTLRETGVDTCSLKSDPDYNTTLAFVSLSSNGEREFSFYRNPGADTRLSPDDLDKTLLESVTFLHIGSLSLTHEPSRSATLKAIRIVAEAGGIVSYDPNWRPSLWASQEEGLAAMKSLFPLSHLVKVSEEELSLLFGIQPDDDTEIDRGAGMILETGAKMVCVTLGPRGVYYKTRKHSGFVPCESVKVVDTTGAGDSFVGGLLYRLSRLSKGVDPFDRDADSIRDDLVFANAVASLCVTRRGAIPALPNLAEVEVFLRSIS